jgi:hypothetical protein
LVAEAEENNLGWDVKNPKWHRWHTCSLCEQEYHGVVACALGWACWKTYLQYYLGRPETSILRQAAMTELGNGLHAAKHYEDALSVGEAELAMLWRLGAPEDFILATLSNLAAAWEGTKRPYRCNEMYTPDA